MNNRVHYGQYSLKHWIDLILKENIVLPEYQRFFVWDENKVRTLIDAFKTKQFVPPITIGAFKIGDTYNNLILDGQQRLTSVLLAYLGLYPDQVTFRAAQERMADENDTEIEEEEGILDNVLEWSFKKLTDRGKNKTDILASIVPGNYKYINLNITENFLKKTFLGFSYLVPDTENPHQQLKYYSSVFRNINIQGVPLHPQESRASLYFLNENLKQFFDPPFRRSIVVRNFNTETKADFVRFLSLLSQYARDGNSTKIARGYKPKMEKYYEEYIYSVVGEEPSLLFKDFSQIFPDGEYMPRIERLEQAITALGIPKQYTSIIDIDVYLFGLIYYIIFEDKVIDIARAPALREALEAKITEFKGSDEHRKSPGALKYLKARINASIEIYSRYVNG